MITTRIVSELRRGSIFWLHGQKYKLLYRNACRALIEPANGKKVVVRHANKKTGLEDETCFESRNRWSISPGTIVEVHWHLD